MVELAQYPLRLSASMKEAARVVAKSRRRRPSINAVLNDLLNTGCARTIEIEELVLSADEREAKKCEKYVRFFMDNPEANSFHSEDANGSLNSEISREDAFKALSIAQSQMRSRREKIAALKAALADETETHVE